jgi:hypothetical protein
MQSNKRRARVVIAGAAVLPAVFTAVASAAPSVLVTNQGVAHDFSGNVAAGYNGWLLTLVADPGKSFNVIDLGDNTASKNGIFGSLLQDWQQNKAGTFPTPTSIDSNGGGFGLDSHLLLTPSMYGTASPPFEDSNLLNPGGSVPANDPFNRWGTGTYLRGAIEPLTHLNSQPLAYVVVPAGTQPTFTISGQEITAVGDGQQAFEVSSVPPPPEPPHNIVWHGSNQFGQPTSYGKSLYSPAELFNGALSEFWFLDFTWPSTPHTEVYALDLKVGGQDPTAAQIAQIVKDINGNSYGINGALPIAGTTFAAQFPGYDIVVLTSGSFSTQNFAVDFNQEQNVPGIKVTAVESTVPEPGAWPILAAASAILLLSRRRTDNPTVV